MTSGFLTAYHKTSPHRINAKSKGKLGIINKKVLHEESTFCHTKSLGSNLHVVISYILLLKPRLSQLCVQLTFQTSTPSSKNEHQQDKLTFCEWHTDRRHDLAHHNRESDN